MKEGERRREGHSSGVCVPGDDSFSVLGLLQCSDEGETERQTHTLREREVERRGGWGWGSGVRGPSISTRDKQTYSPEQVQYAQDEPSVCINKHYPATTTLVHVCWRSPVSPAPSAFDPSHYRSLLTGTETVAPERRWSVFFFLPGGGCTFACKKKMFFFFFFLNNQTLLQVDGEQEPAAVLRC